MHARRGTRPLTGVLGLLICGVASGALSGALTGAPAAHADGADPGKLVLVLDSSGSMKEPAGGAETKIAAARTALRSVVADLPDDQPVGLRVYGARVFDRSDAGACTDSQLEVPVATDNRQQLLSAVGSYKPYGETPIGYALQQAGKDLGDTGKRSIVLVSDGEPTCDPDPCQVARQLARSGIDLKIDVVGLDVNSSARRALQCIANAGRGTYYDVSDSREFAASLQKVATRAARPFTSIGRPVSGGNTSMDAPTVTTGDWLDRTNGVKDRYYLVDRSQPGSTVHFSAAFRDPDTTIFNTVALSTPDGESCGASGSVEQLATNTLIASAATASPLSTFGDIEPDSPCATSSQLLAKVTYSGRTLGVPVEIRVTELPPVKNLRSLPGPVEEPRWVTPPTGDPKRIQGGTSFDDPPLLASGSYRDSIVQGETLTYQVDVDWGQQLTAQVDFPALTGRAEAAVEGSPLAKVSLFSPARAPAGSAGDGWQPASFLRKGTEARLGSVAGPVAFRNTPASNSGTSGSDVAGHYTVTVFMAKKPGTRSVPAPFRLRLGVSGTPHGEPVFASTPVSPDSRSASPSPSDGATDTGDREDTGSTHAAAGGGSGGFPSGPVLAGLGVAALMAAAAVTLRSVRRSAG
jgi:Ca-activated chloride channel homolog